MTKTNSNRPQASNTPLPRRKLGSTGLEVSILGLGTVKLGRNQGVKYPQAFVLPDDREAGQLLDLARESGINLIDTAPAYGNSEERLGKLLKGQRDHWIICTKVGEEFHQGQSAFHFDPAHTRLSVERSLQRLQLEVLDILLVHSDGDDEKIIKHYGTLDALEDLKREGKIRSFGMSTKTVKGGLLAASRCDVVMATWNLGYHDEVPVIDRCLELNKGVLIKKALASGHSANPSAGDQNTQPEDPVATTLSTLLGHQGVSSIIIGSINPKHILSNIQAAIAANP